MSARAAGLVSARKARSGGVFEVGGVDEVEVVAGDRVGGGGEGEEVVDGGGELGGALVAVALHAVDPLGLTTRARTTRAISSSRVRITGRSGREWSLW